MDVKDQIVVVTGAARGIGRALCFAMHAAGARVVVSDRDAVAAQQTAGELGVLSCPCDVGSEAETQALVAYVEEHLGPIDIFVANAGITFKGGLETTNEQWQQLWDVNVMSRVFAARAVVPGMVERSRGCLVQVASAAGLLTEVGSAGYSVTKHADLAFAEWLSVRYGREGVQVACVCPLGVETDMLDPSDPVHQFLQVSAISADAAATAILQGIINEDFLILPHPEVADFFRMKADDPQRWLRGMQRLQQKWQKKQAKQKAA